MLEYDKYIKQMHSICEKYFANPCAFAQILSFLSFSLEKHDYH